MDALNFVVDERTPEGVVGVVERLLSFEDIDELRALRVMLGVVVRVVLGVVVRLAAGTLLVPVVLVVLCGVVERDVGGCRGVPRRRVVELGGLGGLVVVSL